MYFIVVQKILMGGIIVAYIFVMKIRILSYIIEMLSYRNYFYISVNMETRGVKN